MSMQSDPREEIQLYERTELLTFALNLVSETAPLVVKLAGRDDLEVVSKSDASPVTIVDREVEILLRERISKAYPSHGIIGEELPALNPQSELQWTIDPIDGTENLVQRIPTFGTLLGLRFRDRPIVGIIDHPMLGLLLHAGFGCGAWEGARRLSVRDEPARARLGPELLIALSTRSVFERSGDGAVYDLINAAHDNLRIYYDCYAHSLAARASLAAVVEYNLKIWDLTPIELLMEEAGGRYLELVRRDGRYNAIFGRPRVVELLRQIISAAGHL